MVSRMTTRMAYVILKNSLKRQSIIYLDREKLLSVVGSSFLFVTIQIP